MYKRREYALLAMLLTAGHYMVRQSLNFAILEIAEPPVKNPIVQTCMQHLSITGNITKRAIQLNGKKQWTGDQHGNMLAAFYYGYIIGMFPAALLSQHVGCYPIVSIVGLLNGLFHILFPMAIEYSYNMGWAVRFLLGLSSSPLTPALVGSFYWWSVNSEITITIAIQTAGTALGAFLGSVVTGLMIKHFSWQMAFYVEGTIALLIAILWILLADPKPEDRQAQSVSTFCSKIKISSRMTQEELHFILADRSLKEVTTLQSVPWKEIMKSYPIGVTAFAWFGAQYLVYNGPMSVPAYLNRVHNIPVPKLGIIFGLVSLTVVFSTIVISYAIDEIRRRTQLTDTRVRKLFAVACSIMILSCLLSKSFGIFSCSSIGEGGLLIIYILFSMIYAICVIKPLSSELAGTYSLVVYGFVNVFATAAGLLAPTVLGAVLKGKNQGDPESWNMIFIIAAIIGAVSIAMFVLFGTAERQPWAKSKESVDETKEDFVEQLYSQL